MFLATKCGLEWEGGIPHANQPDVTVALVGARIRNQVRNNARALHLQLSKQEIDHIRQIADNVIKEPVGPEFMEPLNTQERTFSRYFSGSS